MKICLWTSVEIHGKGTLRELKGFFGVYENTSTLGLYVCTFLRAFGALLITSGVSLRFTRVSHGVFQRFAYVFWNFI